MKIMETAVGAHARVCHLEESIMRTLIRRVHVERRPAGGRQEAPARWRCTVACLVTLALGVLVGPLATEAQPPGKVYRLGYLATVPPPPHLWEALLDGLRERGYREGHNLVFERRFSDGQAERFAVFATEMVQLKVDCVIAITTPAALAVTHTTQTIPIVMTTAIDPVGAGLVASLARPGGTVTGNALLYAELSTKRLEFLKEAVPGLSRVGVLWNAANPANASVWQETQMAARALGLVLDAQDVRSAQDFAAAFARTAQAHPEALLVLDDALINVHRDQIAQFATQAHLPSVFAARESVVAGGLMSYGPSLPALFRRAATYVDRILQGTPPADLPMEQPMQFELVINLTTAKALGLTIPPTLLFQANEVLQ
jgi:putative ABC transport system substrate-binding protein